MGFGPGAVTCELAVFGKPFFFYKSYFSHW